MQWVGIIMGAVNTLVSILLAVRLLFVEGKARKIENLEADLRVSAERLIDAKLATKTGELRELLQATKTELENVRRELANGRERMQRMADRDREIETQLLKSIGDVREQMATRQDLNKIWDAIRREEGIHA
jgi:Skp family chaperone for outer membrane proteins